MHKTSHTAGSYLFRGRQYLLPLKKDHPGVVFIADHSSGPLDKYGPSRIIFH